MQLVTPNAQQMFPRLLKLLKQAGVRRDSRNGPVIMLPEPIILQYDRPWERLVYWSQRDCNPYFHFMEALWMMAGRNDVELPAKYVSTMKNFSDDGIVFNAAYGFRWRQHFGVDQLPVICDALRANPECRRQVLAIWDGHHDLGLNSKDLPCNTQAMFLINDGKLDMTVMNRSNDAVWGAVGANVFHFSFLQEVMAASIGVPVGRYFQVSNNMHLYVDRHEELMEELSDESLVLQYNDPYVDTVKQPIPVVNGDMETWMQDLSIFLDEGPIVGFRDRFFRRVAVPVYNSWEAYNKRSDPQRFEKAREILAQCGDEPMKLACSEWLYRREAQWVANGRKLK